MSGKTLWYIACARRFSLFWDWVNRVDFVDKLVVKNYMLDEAHEIAMNYFFAHDYDYFIVSCDDVLGCFPEYMRLLLEDEEKHNFPVVSGWHNVRLDKLWASVSLKPHDGIKTKRSAYGDYHFILIKDIIWAKYGYPFIKVWYMGLPFTLIRRETLKKVRLRPFKRVRDRLCRTQKAKSRGRGMMFDLQFAIDCARKRIPIIVDQRIFLLHFKPYASKFRVGKDKPSIEFIPAKV